MDIYCLRDTSESLAIALTLLDSPLSGTPRS